MARASKILYYYYLHYLGDRETDPASSNSLSACTIDGATDCLPAQRNRFFKKLKSSRAAACKPPYNIRKWTEWLLPAYLCSSGLTTGTKLLTPPLHTHQRKQAGWSEEWKRVGHRNFISRNCATGSLHVKPETPTCLSDTNGLHH